MNFKDYINEKIKYKNSEIYDNITENIPVDFIYKYKRKDASKKTNLPNGKMVNIDDLYDDIIKNGLNDPVLLRLNKNTKRIKLESGNHRIEAFKKNKEELIPCILEVVSEKDDNSANGSHSFEISGIDWDSLILGSFKPSKYLSF